MSNAEQQPQGPEHSVETPKVSAEIYESLEKSVEHKAEHVENGEKAAEKAGIEALKLAISVEAGSAEKKTKVSDNPTPRRKGGISKSEKKKSYKKTLTHVQAELPAAQRAFSKVIHNPAVEKTSEVVGSTVARPNALLSGGIVAFALVLAVYIVAKTFGYPLSGFESFGAFIVGYAIGILYDYFRVLITGKR